MLKDRCFTEVFILYPCVSVWCVSESEGCCNCLSVCLFMSVCMCVCVSVCLCECISVCLCLSVFMGLLVWTVDNRVWRTTRPRESIRYVTPNFGQGAQWFYFAEGKVNR